MGDYASVALFAGKTVLKNFGLTLQARYEWSGQMKINENILLYGRPSNYNPDATGHKKVFISPQISYTQDNFTIFATTDLPLYQYLNSNKYYTQVGSQHTSTVGVSYKFYLNRLNIKSKKGTSSYACPMHPEEVSSQSGTCSMCHMELEKK